MTHEQFRTRAWIAKATEEKLLDYLQHLLVVQQRQNEEIASLVQSTVEEQLVMREEMEQATIEASLPDNTPPRTPWFKLGLAGLAGYLLGRSRD